MGLTKSSVGHHACDQISLEKQPGDIIIALLGNPNTGKSTVFNALTGMNQHTGNWTGKTVESAYGATRHQGKQCIFVDLPGTYSLSAKSPEEEVARKFITEGQADCTVVVADATCLERNLNLVLQTTQLCPYTILCLNLMDEAKRKGIVIDIPALENALGIPVIPCAARAGQGLTTLLDAVIQMADADEAPCPVPLPYPRSMFAEGISEEKRAEIHTATIVLRAEEIANMVIQSYEDTAQSRDRKIDRLLTSRKTGIPIMLLLLAGILFLTIIGANYPSEALSKLFFHCTAYFEAGLIEIHTPAWLHSLLIVGGWNVLSGVVSVMLPPMAIFFPLFTLLEDVGYLPRVAFNLDHAFCKARTCGKQALTMCMGFGCNAAGVIGCRIIDSPRERLIAILTNSFVPCNGRFPAMISLLAIFFTGMNINKYGTAFSALLLTFIIVIGIFTTLLVSRLLSATILKGTPSSFALELPPYRCPQVSQVIIRSVFDRTLFVLGRAVIVAIPAGLIIWLMGNVSFSETPLLTLCAEALDPFARCLGLDGVVLFAFILGFPANEIVLPLTLMGYLSVGTLVETSSLSDLAALLIANGWTAKTALCFILFSLFHWPCSTTCLTIHKETGSLKWTLLSIVLPTILGILCCGIVNFVSIFL